MIKFKYGGEEVVIDSGKLTTGGEFEREMFNRIKDEPLKPWEGPNDYALANRMFSGRLGQSDILEEEYPEQIENRVY